MPPWSRARSGPGVGKEGIATIPPPDLTPKRLSMRLMPVAKAGPSSVANLPGAVGLAAGHAEGLLFLAADDDGLLEFAAVGAGRGGSLAGRVHPPVGPGVGCPPGGGLAARPGWAPP